MSRAVVFPAGGYRYPPGSFQYSGGVAAEAGSGSYLPRTVRLGDTSPDGLREKMRCVMGKMEARLLELGFGWADALAAHAYTVHDIGALADAELFRQGCGGCGLDWHFARPPLEGVEFEMDVRAVTREIII